MRMSRMIRSVGFEAEPKPETEILKIGGIWEKAVGEKYTWVTLRKDFQASSSVRCPKCFAVVTWAMFGPNPKDERFQIVNWTGIHSCGALLKINNF